MRWLEKVQMRLGGVDARWGVGLVDVGRWVGVEIVAHTGGGIWDRTGLAEGREKRMGALGICPGWSSIEGEKCPAF